MLCNCLNNVLSMLPSPTVPKVTLFLFRNPTLVGFKMTMSSRPCHQTPGLCCTSDNVCSNLATCHMAHFLFIITAPSKHRSNLRMMEKAAGFPPLFATSLQVTSFPSFRLCSTRCLLSEGYIGKPIHNEITLGFNGKEHPPKLHTSYWYNATMNHSEHAIDFDPYGSFNKYTVTWTPSQIIWKVNDKTLHIDKGIPGKTIPYEPLSTRFVLRASSEHSLNDVLVEYEYFKYTPLPSDLF